MIKGLAITPPVLGRISIGRVVEKNGKRLPEKDDQFTITTQVQNPEGWLLHPLDGTLREAAGTDKLRSIPVRMLFNDPALNLRAEYTLFDRKQGRPLCMGNGETCRRQTEHGAQQLPCPGPDACELGRNGNCKPYGRLHVRIGDSDEVGTFVFRTTGFNSIRTLAARLRYYQAVSGDLLACLPLELKLRGKSTAQSHRTPIYYVDLTVRDGMSLEEAVDQARATSESRWKHGIDQERLDEAARQGFANATFEHDDQEAAEVLEEFYPEHSSSRDDEADRSGTGTLAEKLRRKATSGIEAGSPS